MDSMLKSRMGQPTYLSRDEEALVISASVMKGAHDLPTTRKSVAVKLNRVVEGVSGKDRDKPVKNGSKLRYAQRVIIRVNNNENDTVGQKREVQQAK